LTEVPDESGVGTVLVDNGANTENRLVILYVRTESKSRFVEECLRVGLDLSNLTLYSSSGRLRSDDRSNGSANIVSNSRERPKSESILVESRVGGRIDQGALGDVDIDLEEGVKEL